MIADGMTIALTLVAFDKMSRVIKDAVGKSDTEFDKMQKKLKKTSEMMNTLGRNAAALGGSMTLAGGGLAYTLGLTDAIPQAIETEKRLREIGNVGNLAESQIAGLNKELTNIRKITNQTRPELLEAMNFYTAQGIVNTQKLTEMTKVAGRVATAENANITEVATAAFRVTDNLKVPVNQLNKVMDILAQSGKEGSFELKNMAQYFPQLTASAASLKMNGVPAVAQLGASLQIAAKGAGDASTAANNFANFLGKVNMPSTFMDLEKLEGKGFKGLTNQWEAAMKAKDPVYEIVKLVQKLNVQGVKTTAIFQDKQVLDFVNIMLPNLKEYERIKNKTLAANGVIDKDFANNTKIMAYQWQNLKGSINDIAQSELPAYLSKVNGIITTINAHPILQKGIFNLIIGTIGGGLILTTLGGISMAVGSIAENYGKFAGYARDLTPALKQNVSSLLKMAGLNRTAEFVKNPTLNKSLANANPFFKGQGYGSIFGNFGADMKRLDSNLKAGIGNTFKKILPEGIFKSIASMRIFNLSLLASPIGWIALAIGATAFVIYKYWKPITAFFKGVWKGLMIGLAPLKPMLNSVATAVKPIVNWFSKLFTPINSAGKASKNFGIITGKAIGGAITGIIKLISWISKVAMKASPLYWLFKGGQWVFKTVGGGVPVAKSAGTIPKYDIGSRYITQTGLGIIHKGEEIATAGTVRNSRRSSVAATFAPNITVSGSGSKEEIQQVVRALFPEFERMIYNSQARAEARAY